MKKMLISTVLLLFFSCSNTESINFIGLFGKSNKGLSEIDDIEKTDEMLDEDIFWDIIDKSLRKANNQQNTRSFFD